MAFLVPDSARLGAEASRTRMNALWPSRRADILDFFQCILDVVGRLDANDRKTRVSQREPLSDVDVWVIDNSFREIVHCPVDTLALHVSRRAQCWAKDHGVIALRKTCAAVMSVVLFDIPTAQWNSLADEVRRRLARDAQVFCSSSASREHCAAIIRQALRLRGRGGVGVFEPVPEKLE